MLLQISIEDLHYLFLTFSCGVVLYRKDDRIIPFIFFAEVSDLFYDILEGDCAVEEKAFDSMSDYRFSVFVMNVYFHTLDPTF